MLQLSSDAHANPKAAHNPNSLGPSQSCLYDLFMASIPNPHRKPNPHLRATVEVAFIIFLFYSNLLMGEFNGVAGQGKTLAFALHDIFTAVNFLIAMASAIIGHLIFEFLRKKL